MVMRWNNTGDVCYTSETGVIFTDQCVLARAIVGCLEGEALDVKIYEGQEKAADRMICRIGHQTPAGEALGLTMAELGFIMTDGVYVELTGNGSVTFIKGRK